MAPRGMCLLGLLPSLQQSQQIYGPPVTEACATSLSLWGSPGLVPKDPFFPARGVPAKPQSLEL